MNLIVQWSNYVPSSCRRVLVLLREDQQMPAHFQAIFEQFPSEEVVEVFVRGEEGKMVSQTAIRLKKEDSKNDREERGARVASRWKEEKEVALDLRYVGEEGLDVVRGFYLASFSFDRYLSSRLCCLEILFVVGEEPIVRPLTSLLHTVKGVVLARELTSEPPNILYPESYALRVKELLEPLGVTVEILSVEELKTIGMNALLAVGQASNHSPCVVVLQWKRGNQEPIAFVGKGVCFDAGGLCLKPPFAQQVMKWDKAGAGVVAGLFYTMAMSNAPVNAIGILGLVENMPGGSALRTGSVLTTMSKQTVEVVDTDAEGRLVLADCLWYVQKRFSPHTLIDLGTLTVETIASLGERYAGLYTDDPMLASELQDAGVASGDFVWRLPMGPYFAKQIVSEVADMKNLGKELAGENGAAAEFLKRFVYTKRWAHIDIAGVSWSIEGLPLSGKGVTGFGVRLLETWMYQKLGVTSWL